MNPGEGSESPDESPAMSVVRREAT